MIKRNNIPMDVIANRVAGLDTDLDQAIEQCEKDMYNHRDFLRRQKLDDEWGTAIYSRRRCMEGLQRIMEWLKELKQRKQSDAWHPVTETPPRGDDLMLKVRDKRCYLDNFRYYVMGFFDGSEFQTYLFRHQDDHDIEIVGWQLCPWKGEE